MVHSSSRIEVIEGMEELLSGSRICWPPTNLEVLTAIMGDTTFKAGNTLTNFLDNFRFSPHVIDVISGGAYTII